MHIIDNNILNLVYFVALELLSVDQPAVEHLPEYSQDITNEITDRRMGKAPHQFLSGFISGKHH
jgi:hypothetical protein